MSISARNQHEAESARHQVASGLSLRHRYHAGIRLRTSEYFH